ncbi:hypothetical protein ACIRD3_03730 [Kitasatospora sp. NPDC093550]|uniref:preATP grasp domain-containing protein n=1 Tax=Kitasatospora sp. NPDC093550 TaxID=3364089 RepID=UPI0037F8FF4A
MRLLIANEVDPMLSWVDFRSYSQRLLWFAEDGDVLVLPGPPGADFLRHVASLTGVDPRSLTFLVPPPGRYQGKVIDPYALLDQDFLAAAAKAVAAAPTPATGLLSCWPSPVVPRFAAALGLGGLVPGAAFIDQGGGELANSKAEFRALAAAAGVPIAPGAVCRSGYEAEQEIPRLLAGTGAVLVKQAHNGAGAGNQLVVLGHGHRTDHVGAKFLHHLEPGPGAVAAYVAEQWAWASRDGRYPVVVEEFQPASRTVYAEFLAEDDGVRFTATGELDYRERRLVRESTPARGLTAEVEGRLTAGAARLAEAYRSLGYRGYLSADAIVDDSGRLVFTELNARVTGSLHLYGPIGGRVVDTARHPRRSVTQHRTPAHWPALELDEFLEIAATAGLGYDPVERRGVLVSIPPVPGVRGGFDYCVVHDGADEEEDLLRRLDGAVCPT